MKKTPLLLVVLHLLFVQFLYSQTSLPIIKANSDQVDIRDGDEFYEQNWTIAPEYKPDVYTSSNKGKKVTFYTDIDSISFDITTDKIHDFIILLNGKDSAYTQIKYKPSFLEVLKGAKDYNKNDKNAIPVFTYQDSEDKNLKALRAGFKLDSIAGTGNEVSKMLNLLHWIHDLIPHNGNEGNPAVKNAMSLINTCTSESKTLNCRGLAIVLNECYLAMGWQSRFMTCLPQDTSDFDCHVINMVYSNDLDKWIWVDPTNDAYVMDETGELLGIEEVRQRLINDEMLILNPDANWNRRNSTIKEYYLFQYMAKNLYRFSCPLNSTYDYETKGKGKKIDYVELLPLDYHTQTPKVEQHENKKTGVTVTTYRTNNPAVFWAKPKQ